MKKLILFMCLFATGICFAQVAKADIDAQLAAFPPSGYEYVFLSNVRVYYTDGTTKLEQKQYYANKLTIEPKDHVLYLRFYKDDSKSTQTDLTIIPYNMIIRTEAYSTGFIIDLLQ